MIILVLIAAAMIAGILPAQAEPLTLSAIIASAGVQGSLVVAGQTVATYAQIAAYAIMTAACAGRSHLMRNP